ncbi:MAG: hypothetical protein NC548_51115, partial [Lachnospiraceae bacterium]|nr:hypothetical protein [Lachnospiraceae bacterium]
QGKEGAMADRQGPPTREEWEKTGKPPHTVKMYIASSVKGPGRRKGSCGYALWCPTRPPSEKNPLTGTMYIGETSEHHALLYALHEAAGRVHSECFLTVHTDSPYIAAALSGWLKDWEANGYLTKKGKPVADAGLWAETAERLAAAGHPVHAALKHTHEWRNWLAWELEKRTAEGRKADKD